MKPAGYEEEVSGAEDTAGGMGASVPAADKSAAEEGSDAGVSAAAAAGVGFDGLLLLPVAYFRSSSASISRLRCARCNALRSFTLLAKLSMYCDEGLSTAGSAGDDAGTAAAAAAGEEVMSAGDAGAGES